MGNQREIRQTSPRLGLGVVLRIRYGRGEETKRILDGTDKKGNFYTYFYPAGEPIEIPNMDFACKISQGATDTDCIVIQSGGKMWCGYENFVDHIRTLASTLEDALFFVADEEDYIDKFLIAEGELHYERVHQGSLWDLEEYLSTCHANFNS